jgi:hypothetical protein
MPSKKVDWRTIDPRLLQAVLMPRGETVKALQVIAEKHNVHLASLYRRLKHLGASRIEPCMGPEALARWERHHRAIARGYRSNMKLVKSIAERCEWIAAENKKLQQRSFTDRELARFLSVTPQWVRFMETIGRLHRGDDGKFSAKELDRFLTENWYMLKAQRLVQRGSRLVLLR